MLQYGGVEVDGLVQTCQTQVEGVVHVGVGGGKFPNLQPTAEGKQQDKVTTEEDYVGYLQVLLLDHWADSLT